MASPEAIERFKENNPIDGQRKMPPRGDTPYVDIYGNPVPDYPTYEQQQGMTEEEETVALQKEMDEALPVDLSHPKFDPKNNSGDPKKPPSNANKLIMECGKLGGKKKTKRKKRKKTKKTTKT